MLTVFEDPGRIFNALAAGAIGYISKTTRPAKLLQMIGEANEGGAPMSSQVARQVVQSFQWTDPSDPISRLSPRELEVLQQLSQARPYREISDKLGISVNTVRSHVRSIYEKLQTRNRTQAVAKNLSRNLER
jgi:DNA-binding NarL/FixJ family response regulator